MRASRQLLLAAMVGVLAVPAAARADGSIAKSADGHTGMSFNYRGERAADQRALEECDGRCRIVLHFERQCAAIAIGRDGGGGWAARERQGRAEEAAMDQCEAQGNRGCRIQQRACDDR